MHECNNVRECMKLLYSAMRGENAPVGQLALQSLWILTFCKPSEGGPHLTLLRKKKRNCVNMASEKDGRSERPVVKPANTFHTRQRSWRHHSQSDDSRRRSFVNSSRISPHHIPSEAGRVLKGVAQSLSGKCRGPVDETEPGMVAKPDQRNHTLPMFRLCSLVPMRYTTSRL